MTLRFILLFNVSLLLLRTSAVHAANVTPTARGLALHLDETSGAYSIVSPLTKWTFGGSLNNALHNVAIAQGNDRIGAYHEIKFSLQKADQPMTGSMRAYDARPVVLFTIAADRAGSASSITFPNFTTIPTGMHPFSYADKVFAPAEFKPHSDGSPWLLFDDQLHAAIISPAAHFAVSLITGDATSSIASVFRPSLANIPAGFAQQTLLAIDQGINQTWDVWGHALTDLHGKDRPANDADTILKYLGYWTDNGAYYYYHYDAQKGYAGTLLSLAEEFRHEQIPVRYLQLDSWWYYKTLTGFDGKEGKPKNADLPLEEWNRYGGLMKYRAHPTVFPDGLAAFDAKLGMPLVTHNRWIDPKSPYHEKYQVSGFAGVDPGYWKEIADYCKSSGVVTYEQDWLNQISLYSPELTSTPYQGDAFLDGMASACRDDGLTMQYCMPLPWELMQGSQYSNLTSSRVSDDRFRWEFWRNFVFTSRLVSALGIWPWTDTYMSGETDNLILSVLSAGPVGFGDEMGKENRDNLLKAARPDGVLVKPDAAIVPIDSSYLTGAEGKTPLVTSTYTDHAGYRTAYVFIFMPSKNVSGDAHFEPAELGFTSDVYVAQFGAASAIRLGPHAVFSAPVAAKQGRFFIVAPVGRSEIAFLGDAGKFVGTGKQRVASLADTEAGIDVDLLFAARESRITLHGYSATAPRISAKRGKVGTVLFDPQTKHFTVEVSADRSGAAENVGGDSVRHVMIHLAA